MDSNFDKLTRKYNAAPSMAQTLGAMGRYGDSLVAHITPREAMMLKRRGGAGTINPRTGLLEFYDADGSGNASDSGNPTGGDGSGGESSADTSSSDPGDPGFGSSVDFGGAGFSGGYFGSDPNNVGGSAATSNPFDPSYFQNLYSTTLNRAPETGALDYWNDYVNRYGLEAATGAFNYGAAQELAARTNAGGVAPGAPVAGPGALPTPTAVVPTTGGAAPISGVGGLGNTPFELANLMRQYGVSSPTIVPNIAQVSEPTQTEQPNKQAYDKQAYQNYLNEYMTRLAQTNMYNRAQFMTDPSQFNQQWSNTVGNPQFAPSNYEDVYNIYSKYLGRTPEEAGVRYWGDVGLAGDPLKQAITTGAQNADLAYFQQNFPNQQYARGGAVRARYAEGGEVISEDPETERSNRSPMTPDGAARLAESLAQLRPTTNYGAQLAGAQQTARNETEAFANTIRQMSERAESPTSRAEMYFRLASAFGAPTRTGQFTENLALAGREMGEYARGRQTDEAERRALALRAQELRAAGARQDLASLQTLAGQEAAAQRAINLRMIDAQMRGATPNARETRIADVMQTYGFDRPTAIRIVDNLIVAVPGSAGEPPTFFDRSTNEIVVPGGVRQPAPNAPRETTPPPAAAPAQAEAPAIDMRRPQVAASTAPATAVPASVEDFYAGRRQRQIEQVGQAAEAEARGRVAAPPAPRQDFRYTQDYQAVEPIPGSVAAQEAEQRARAERVRRESSQQAGNIIIRAIDDAEKAMRTATLPTTGFFAERLSGEGGTAARNLRTDLETIRANIGFDQLNQMRQASPTGGALGNVTIQELTFLQSVLGSVDQSQSEDQLLRNLRRLRDATEQVVNYGLGNRPPVQIPGPGGRGTAEPPPREGTPDARRPAAGAAPAASGEIRTPSGLIIRPIQ